MAKALDGVNILEIDSNLAAAYAAMLLAEQGATAIKVEAPGGAPRRGTPHFHATNRSKRTIALDFESRRSKASIRELIAASDVVVHGLTPAKARALGLDAEAIRAANRRILMLWMPPLGSRGPLADLDADEDIAAAIGAISGNQWTRSGDPSPLTFPAASYSAAVLGATAAVAALIARDAEDAGQTIEVSLLAGALSLQTGGVLRHGKLTTLNSGAQDPLGPIPCYRLFEAADGRFLFIACGNPTFWNKFALAIDHAELVSDARFEGAPWGIPQENWQLLKDILEPIIRSRPRDEWLRILRENDVPCAPVLSRQEFIDDEQVRHLGMRRELRDPTLGSTVQMGIPVHLRDTPGEVSGPTPTSPPNVDAVDRILAQLKEHRPPRLDSHRVSANGGSGGPLNGVVVLDFASYIAGSYGPMILGQLGADVIKVESLEGDSFRHFGFGFLGWNQQKRGLALNLRSAEGREIVYALAEKADVVVENLRPGATRRAGIDYDTLAARNPRLIYMSVNAFGNHGPQHDQPGFDPLLQARSGVMAAQGGHHGHPVYLTCAICDYGAAMLSAFGCVLALRARQLTGRGQLCETTLLQAAMAFQAGEFIFYEGRPDLEDGGAEYRGRSALNRVYRCADDKWLCLTVRDARQWESMRKACGAPSTSFPAAAHEPSEGILAVTLAAHFARISRADALDALARIAVPASAVNRIQELFDDPQVAANELIAELSHSQWARVFQTGMLAQFSGTRGRIERTAPLLGEHSAEVLAQFLGYDHARIADLVARGIIAQAG